MSVSVFRLLVKYLGPPLLLLILVLYLMLQGDADVSAYQSLNIKDYASPSTYAKQYVYSTVKTTKEIADTYQEAAEVTQSYSFPDYTESLEDHERFIQDIAPYAIWLWEEYRIYPSVTLAQCVMESGWGQYAISWNLGGVKDEYPTPNENLEQHLVDGSEFTILLDGEECSGGTCTNCGRQKVLCHTTDIIDGVSLYREQYFVFFATPVDYFKNRAEMFTTYDRYVNQNVTGQSSPDYQIQAIQAGGYSGAGYASSIIEMFNQPVQFNVANPIKIADYDDENSEVYKEARERAVILGLLPS